MMEPRTTDTEIIGWLREWGTPVPPRPLPSPRGSRLVGRWLDLEESEVRYDEASATAPESLWPASIRACRVLDQQHAAWREYENRDVLPTDP